MVSNMLGQNNKGHRSKQHEDIQHIAETSELREAFLEHADEGEFGQMEQTHVFKSGQVDDLQSFDASSISNESERQSDDISAQNTDDERDELYVLGALKRSKYGNQESNNSNQNVNQTIVLRADSGVGDVIDSAAAQGQTDQRNGGADNDGGQQLVNPSRAGLANDQSDNRVHQTGEHSTHEDAHVAKGDRAAQGADEGER